MNIIINKDKNENSENKTWKILILVKFILYN